MYGVKAVGDFIYQQDGVSKVESFVGVIKGVARVSSSISSNQQVEIWRTHKNIWRSIRLTNDRPFEFGIKMDRLLRCYVAGNLVYAKEILRITKDSGNCGD